MSHEANEEGRRFEAQDLIELLEDAGFVLFLEGGRTLRWRAPRGRVSHALMARLDKLEPEIVELLRARAERIKKGAFS